LVRVRARGRGRHLVSPSGRRPAQASIHHLVRVGVRARVGVGVRARLGVMVRVGVRVGVGVGVGMRARVGVWVRLTYTIYRYTIPGAAARERRSLRRELG